MNENFNDWFTFDLIVGDFPIIKNCNEDFKASLYDVIINVSDEYYANIDSFLKRHGCETFWFPMNERGKDIGINSLYGAMVILFNCEKNRKKVYLHCHSGVNRSQTIRAAYHYMRTGKHFEKATLKNNFKNKLFANCHYGYFPKMNEIEFFLININEKLEKDILSAGDLDKLKHEYFE